MPAFDGMTTSQFLVTSWLLYGNARASLLSPLPNVIRGFGFIAKKPAQEWVLREPAAQHPGEADLLPNQRQSIHMVKRPPRVRRAVLASFMKEHRVKDNYRTCARVDDPFIDHYCSLRWKRFHLMRR